MTRNVKKVYDKKIEESKGPSFGLIGTGINHNEDDMSKHKK